MKGSQSDRLEYLRDINKSAHRMEMQYFLAITHYRQRNYEECLKTCNTLLQELQKTDQPHQSLSGGSVDVEVIKDGVWLLKMQAMTNRVYFDDLAIDDDGIENEEYEMERIATTARPGTSIKTAFTPRPKTGLMTGRQRTATARPSTGMARPGTMTSRPGSSIGSRPASRCGTARRVRATSAAAYAANDPMASLYQACRLNPTIYAEKTHITKPLFQFLYYHENDPQKAYSLCEAVASVQKQKVDWWWEQQRGRCLIALSRPKQAEEYLKRAVSGFPHPDNYLLMCKMFLRLHQPFVALQLLQSGIERIPHDVTLRTWQARIYERVDLMDESVAVYRTISIMDAINTEALACIAVSHFYAGEPEEALMYYRRILSMGRYSAELYCNIALCCLYAGQMKFVLPCFQRAIRMASSTDQRADIWYNLSFVGLIMSDYPLFKRCLRLCLSCDAANGAALNNLGVVEAYEGDYRQAKAYFTAAKNAIPDNAEVKKNIKVLDKRVFKKNEKN